MTTKTVETWIDETSGDRDGGDVPVVKVIIKRSDETAKTSLLSDSDDISDASEEGSSAIGRGGWEVPSMIHPAKVVVVSKDSSAAIDVDDNSPWQKPYQPDPVVDQNTVLLGGFFLFGLAVMWPPLILLFAYVASKLIPYSFRTNDCPTTRRKLFAEFLQQKGLPNSYRSLRDRVSLEDNYWTNSR